MGAELSTLTLTHTQVRNATTDIYDVCNGKCGIVRIYANKPTDKHRSPSSSICFSNGDDLKFCLAVLQKNCFYPYASNGINQGFYIIGMSNICYYSMTDMKKMIQKGETCFWNKDKLNIPNTCLTFEEIENLFNEIKRDNTVQPVFNQSERDFPVLPKSRTPSPVVEEISTSTPAVIEKPTLVPDNVPGVDEEETPVSTDVPPPVIVNGMPMVLPTYIPVNGVMSEFNTTTNKVMVYIGNDPVWLTLPYKNE